MRWFESSPRRGEEKIESWFAWFPVGINGQWRWLERVTVRLVYDRREHENDKRIAALHAQGKAAAPRQANPFGPEWEKVEFID